MENSEQIGTKLQTIEQIREFNKITNLIMANESNARSLHDTTTNNRGKFMEEFISSNQLYIINK